MCMQYAVHGGGQPHKRAMPSWKITKRLLTNTNYSIGLIVMYVLKNTLMELHNPVPSINQEKKGMR